MRTNSAELAALVEMIAPPSVPLRNGDEHNWTALRAEISFDFPNEFFEFGRLYGTGEIDAEGYGLLIANPLDPAYPNWIRTKSEEMQSRGDPQERRATRFYPEDRGVVPFAENWSGELLFLTPHRPSARVAICPTGDPNELITYTHGFATFLVTLFTGRLKPEYFPNPEMRKRKPKFKKRAWLK